MNTKMVLAIVGVAVVAAALVGVTTAQLIGAQNITNPAVTQTVPPCSSSTGGVPSNCVNATTGQPYCYSNGTATGYCQNGGCYGFQSQDQNQYQYGNGMMSQTGYGCDMGHHR
jgi:hypothetical protein